MVSDNSQLHQDGSAALDPASLSAQGGEERGQQAVFTPEEQATLRAELIKANPNTVAELITGGTVNELIASVRNAEAAYHRVHQQIANATPTTAGGGVRSADVVGAGGASSAMATGRLDPFTKISIGLSQNDGVAQVGAMGMSRLNYVGRK